MIDMFWPFRRKEKWYRPVLFAFPTLSFENKTLTLFLCKRKTRAGWTYRLQMIENEEGYIKFKNGRPHMTFQELDNDFYIACAEAMNYWRKLQKDGWKDIYWNN